MFRKSKTSKIKLAKGTMKIRTANGQHEEPKLCAVILAAGEGKRMQSSKPKVLLEVLLKPMLGWVVDAAHRAGIEDICVVTGHKEELVKAYLGPEIMTVTQTERKGTGHAVMMARDFLEAHRGCKVLIACGDAPFLNYKTVKHALEQHTVRGDAVTVISASLEDPSGYGRIIREDDGSLLRIVEQKEATMEELSVREVNSGTYWFDVDALLKVLDPEHLAASGITGEHYLTDTIAALIEIGRGAGAYSASSPDVVMGANNPVQLHELNELARKKYITKQVVLGANIPCYDGIIIGPDVTIGPDTSILPGSVITGVTTIGSGCMIGPNATIHDSSIADNVVVTYSHVKESTLLAGCDVGPFSQVRPGSVVGENVHIGTFVEVKNSNIGSGTQVAHLAYIGDCDMGKDVNFGCGSITVNYDGKDKNRTVVGDNAFIGCNTNLIAPLTVGEGAVTAAGTTVTADVPENSLAIGRVRQETKEGWVEERRSLFNVLPEYLRKKPE